MEQKPARSRRSFTDEFKRDAVAMVLDDGNKIVDVARRLGIGEGTLGNWVAQARTDRGERAGLTTRSAPSWPSCARRTRGCGWNEICSTERRPSG
jgi:transposase-like protein